MTENCNGWVKAGGPWSMGHDCFNRAKRDGYCEIHHPDAVRRRREKTEARDKALGAKEGEKRERDAFNIRAGARCRELGIQPEDINDRKTD